MNAAIDTILCYYYTKNMNIPLLFENNEIWIFAKPSGLAVQSGKGVSQSLIGYLQNLFEQKVYPVHRLDAATRGIIVIAKNPYAAHLYSSFFADSKSVTKIYHAVVWGNAPNHIAINESIAVHKKHKTACSTVSKIESWPPYASLVKVVLSSGRMHQIRIHLKQAEIPIIGDDKYGNFTLNRSIKSPLALYANELIIKSKNIHVIMPIHQELRNIKKALTAIKMYNV